MVVNDSRRIQFHYLVKSFSFPQRTDLKGFLLKTLKRKGRVVNHINYVFCSDPYLLQLNKTHLGHDYYTDIITFELSARKAELVADIYISVDRVRDNARKFASSFKHELHRVIFHGALHLCGYRDKKTSDQAEMRRQENVLLQQYFGSTWNAPPDKH